jgi:HEAT repeat protein
VRYEIVGALAEIGGEDVVDALIELLTPDSWAAKGHYLPSWPGFPPYWWPDGRSQVIGALAMLKAKRSAPALLKVLQEKGNGMGYLGEFIIPVLGDFEYGDPTAELMLILTTGEIAGVHPAPLPPEAVLDEQKRVKAKVNRFAARTLLQLGDRCGCTLLNEELANPDRDVRRFVAETFARFGEKADIPLLAGRLEDENREVRRWACFGLERITGTVNRAPGRAESSEEDAYVWLSWWDMHKSEYEKR